MAMNPLGTSAVTPIVALDVPDMRSAKQLVEELGDECTFYKVGLELFTAEGPPIVAWLRGEGREVFVDLKLHDIPNTVRAAARSVARLGASLLTVHASGGSAMVAAAVEGAAEGAAEGEAEGSGGHGEPSGPSCRVLAVTVLTSLDAGTLGSAWGRDPVDVTAEVSRLAGIARDGGAAGVVCSGHEAAQLTATFGHALGLLVPGIRLTGSSADDQRRIVSPEAAAAAGARWIILGRTVTGAASPRAAMAGVRQALAMRGRLD